jgi:magnesium chelatase subunit D
MPPNFPFAAIVGQDALRAALLWIAVDPGIGGLLVTGTRGTAKSTAARALADLLPPLEVIANDPYNSPPGIRDAAMSVPTPFVELPLGATEERVIGTLDVRALLADRQTRFEPGLLARANRGILYVDEVNLLPDHLVDVLLDAAATGRNVVERDGASHAHDARIVLVGTMNPEEGELRPQLLDRFGLCVAIASDEDLERRIAIVERRLAFDRDPVEFCARYADADATQRARVQTARALLPDVSVGPASVRHAAALALEARAEGMRADLAIVRTARAIAALDERLEVSAADIERAALAALAHRRREATSPPAPRPPASGSPPPNGSQRDRDEQAAKPTSEPPATFAVGTPTAISLLEARTQPRRVPRLSRDVARGVSAIRTATGRARLVRNVTSRISAFGTIQAAGYAAFFSGTFTIRHEHLRFLERHGRERQLVVFVVDASGSMAAAARMRAAKGVVCGLLVDAYRRRDAVALVAFRGSDAQVLVPPTRSALLAYRRLRSMRTGGRTPLAAGLARGCDLLTANARRDPAARAHLVLVTDARANAPEVGAFPAALREAARIRATKARILCVDTEGGLVRLQSARRLAAALGATYRHLEDCSERALGATVKEWMAIA